MLQRKDYISDAAQRNAGSIDNPNLADLNILQRHFTLGMPHMGYDGVSRGWMLRQACHAHWGAIASNLKAKPTDFQDRDGARVLPSVVACTINGDAARFCEDDVCTTYLTEQPRRENGWRSQLELHNGRANVIRVEIVTSFARRAGGSNRDLEPANLAPAFQAARDHPDARRTSLIRRLGKSMRVRATADADPPHRIVPVDRHHHVNGVGLVYFAAIHDILEAAEYRAIPDLVHAWPMRDRRVHFYGNLDVGDCFEVTSRASVQSLSPSGSVVVQSHARRGSDGTLIVASESIYEAY